MLCSCRVALVPEANSAVLLLRSFLGQSNESAEGRGLRQKLDICCEDMDLLDLNYALYRCDQEERDDGFGGGTYEVPGAGSFVYCGLQGIVSMLAKVSQGKGRGGEGRGGEGRGGEGRGGEGRGGGEGREGGREGGGWDGMDGEGREGTGGRGGREGVQVRMLVP